MSPRELADAATETTDAPPTSDAVPPADERGGGGGGDDDEDDEDEDRDDRFGTGYEDADGNRIATFRGRASRGLALGALTAHVANNGPATGRYSYRRRQASPA